MSTISYPRQVEREDDAGRAAGGSGAAVGAALLWRRRPWGYRLATIEPHHKEYDDEDESLAAGGDPRVGRDRPYRIGPAAGLAALVLGLLFAEVAFAGSHEPAASTTRDRKK